MKRMNTNRPEDVDNSLKHKPIKGFGNSQPRKDAIIAAKKAANDDQFIPDECVCDEDYESLSDEDINILIAENLELADIKYEKFDPCNVHDDAWLILENFNCTMDIDGTCYAHQFNIRIKCKGKILRAVMIAYLLTADLL